jgi:hypothetical protein
MGIEESARVRVELFKPIQWFVSDILGPDLEEKVVAFAHDDFRGALKGAFLSHFVFLEIFLCLSRNLMANF